MKQIILAIFLIHVLTISAQNGLTFHYSVQEGLPSSEVYGVTQDQFGFIWILTDKGVSRFDGYDFVNFSEQDGLSDNVIFDSYRSPDGDIWMLGHNMTVSILRGEDPVFLKYEYNDTIKKYGGATPSKLLVDKKGNLYVSFIYMCGFLQIDSAGHPVVFPDKDCVYDTIQISFPIEDEPFCQIRNSDKKTDSYRWSSPFAFVNNYIFRADLNLDNEKAVYKLGLDKIEVRGRDHQVLIQEDEVIDKVGFVNEELLWVSFRYKGLKFYDFHGREVFHVFEHESISNFFIDTEGNYWISTINNGVFLIPHGEVLKKNPSSFENRYVTDLEVSSDSNLVVAYQNGNIEVLYGRNLCQIYTSFYKLPASISNTVDGAHTYYMSDHEIRELNTGRILGERPMGNPRDMMPLKSGDMGFMAYVGFFKVSPDGKISDECSPPKKVFSGVEYEDKLYLASYHGLYVSNDSTYSSFSQFRSYSKRVNDLIVLDGFFFLGTNGDGLKIYKDEQLIGTLDNSLIGGDFITKLYSSDDSTVWIGSNTGLARLVFRSAGHHRYSYSVDNISDQLPCREVRSLVELRDTLWIGTSEGLYYLDIDRFDRKRDDIDHHLKIDDVSVNDLDFDGDLADLNYSQNRLVFSFTGISLDPTTDLIYRYKLEGAEENWNYTEGRKAIYANLSPGVYNFILQLKGEHSNWKQEQVELAVIIHPPYWETPWFRVTIFLVLLGLIYLFFRFRILLYNKDLVREILRLISKRISRSEPAIVVREGNKNVKIYSSAIFFVKSDGNYLEIHHEDGKTTVRQKIGEFMELVPDPLEYVRIRRSFIVRIDKVQQKGRKEVVVNGLTIPVGKTYLEELEKINF